ncbi:MAG TPA: TetR/AcrR family transcriptional regulator [Reyranella sp.]|nr:TetR/AcrR family transcriptional regulator [Reyranella sp.]
MAEPAPTPAPQWQRRKAERPAEIADAALRCFAERGFAATRLDDVAKRAGVTKGTLYLYFPNKEELFKAVVRQFVIPNLTRSEAIASQSTMPASEVLAQLLENWARVMVPPASAIPKIVLSEAGNFPDITRFYLDEVVHRGLALFEGLLKAGIERGEFRRVDTHYAAHCIAAPMLLGMLWRHSFEPLDGQPLDMLALARTHLQLLASGLEADRT